jgi:hypothetical protein
MSVLPKLKYLYIYSKYFVLYINKMQKVLGQKFKNLVKCFPLQNNGKSLRYVKNLIEESHPNCDFCQPENYTVSMFIIL